MTAINVFLDALQRVADLATNAKGKKTGLMCTKWEIECFSGVVIGAKGAVFSLAVELKIRRIIAAR